MDGYTDPDIADRAIEALLMYGGQLTRDRAATLLPMWRDYRELTRRDIAAVLERFGQARIEPGNSGPGW